MLVWRAMNAAAIHAKELNGPSPGLLTVAKDAAWAAYCSAPTSRDMGRSKVDAAAAAVVALIVGPPRADERDPIQEDE
jgi:hypothetical protein